MQATEYFSTILQNKNRPFSRNFSWSQVMKFSHFRVQFSKNLRYVIIQVSSDFYSSAVGTLPTYWHFLLNVSREKINIRYKEMK